MSTSKASLHFHLSQFKQNYIFFLIKNISAYLVSQISDFAKQTTLLNNSYPITTDNDYLTEL